MDAPLTRIAHRTGSVMNGLNASRAAQMTQAVPMANSAKASDALHHVLGKQIARMGRRAGMMVAVACQVGVPRAQIVRWLRPTAIESN